jgi:hypothetical protein
VKVYGWSDIGSDKFFNLSKLRFSPICLHLPRTLHAKRIYFIIKLGYSMTKVYDDYTNKEFNTNYKNSRRQQYCF